MRLHVTLCVTRCSYHPITLVCGTLHWLPLNPQHSTLLGDSLKQAPALLSQRLQLIDGGQIIHWQNESLARQHPAWLRL